MGCVLGNTLYLRLLLIENYPFAGPSLSDKDSSGLLGIHDQVMIFRDSITCSCDVIMGAPVSLHNAG